MAFSLVPLAAFVDGAVKLTASTLNYWRTAIASAIDAVGGSGGAPYTPVTAIEVEGAGLYGDPLWGWVRSGKTLGIDTGGHLLIYGEGTVQPDGVFYVDGTSGHPGEIQVKNHGNLHALSGSSSVWESGSTWKLATPSWNGTSGALIAYGGGIKVGDSALGVGTILVDGSGSASGLSTGITVQGGALLCATGATTKLKVLAGAELLVNASDITLQSGATLTASSSCTTTLNGKLVRSGTSAYTLYRHSTFTSGTITSPQNADFWEVDGSGNVTLGTTGTENGTKVHVFMAKGFGTKTISIDGVTVGHLATAGAIQIADNGQPAYATFVLVSGAWKCIAASKVTFTGDYGP